MSGRRSNRKQKVRELMESFHSSRHTTAFRTAEFAKMSRITPSQWGALMMVERRGASTVKDVAKGLGITSSATTQLINGLVTSGYLMRETCAEDRRMVKLTLSDKTKNQVDKMKKEVLRNFLKLFEALNDEEFNQYIRLNRKIAGIFAKNKDSAAAGQTPPRRI